jgi:membrane protein insertase Oxa1/YidC/SpoIIIJ
MNCCILIAILALVAFITSLLSMNKIKSIPEMPGSTKKDLQNQNMVIMLVTFVILVYSLGCLAKVKKYGN